MSDAMDKIYVKYHAEGFMAGLLGNQPSPPDVAIYAEYYMLGYELGRMQRLINKGLDPLNI